MIDYRYWSKKVRCDKSETRPTGKWSDKFKGEESSWGWMKKASEAGLR